MITVSYLVGMLPGGKCAVLFLGKMFCTETIKIYFVFMKIWKEICSLKLTLG